jgi:hypothetical protein
VQEAALALLPRSARVLRWIFPSHQSLKTFHPLQTIQIG